MKAVTLQGPGKVEVREVPDPAILKPTDAILRVTAAGICGSDLHYYSGRIDAGTGWVIGHEYTGIVEEVGSQVTQFKPGDRVVGVISPVCGTCYYCRNQQSAQCSRKEPFGFGGDPGCQADYLRVAYADVTLEKIPDSLSFEQAIFVGDIFSTGFHAAHEGGIKVGDVVAAIGAGPVGLFAQVSAQLFGPAVVLAIDSVPERLALAEKMGAIPVNMAQEDALARVQKHTEGRGADVVLEAVGLPGSINDAFRYVRPGGVISSVGVYAETEFAFPMNDAFGRSLTFKIGVCPARNYMKPLLSLIEQGRVDPTLVITHQLPLAEAARAYDIFASHKDGCIKVLLKP
jgi:2-desacetyl-2-hydroxyethyl bacteriochlorophyllide A dehydrogenase